MRLQPLTLSPCRRFLRQILLAILAEGTANAQPVTLSFWAQCSGITGTFSGSINNPALNRSYPFSFRASDC